MGNLVRMDLYRMFKGRSFKVCLIIAFVLALGQTPFGKLMVYLANMLSSETSIKFPESTELSLIIGDPLPLLNGMLAMLSVTMFFHADVEFGYIKNIAGQMPKKGFTVFSKFLAAIPHNLVFMLVGVIGNLIGTLLCQRIVFDAQVLDGVRIFLLRFLLLQSICAILLLVSGSLGSKSLGTVLAVLLGMGLLGLVYGAIDAGLNQLFRNKGFALNDYMPDQLLGRPYTHDPTPITPNLNTWVSIIVAAVTTGIFLPGAIHVFDRKDVK